MYELVKDTTVEKQPNIDVVLVSYVDGIGNVGDRVSVKPTVAYNSLLLPGLAVYATPENVGKYANKGEIKEEEVHSSPFAQRVNRKIIIINKLIYMYYSMKCIF